MRAAVVVLLAFLASTSASAATVDQIVALSRAGVSEPVILALIDRDRSIITLDADQLVALEREGVSERVVLAMLKSGRSEADAAIRAESEMRLANIAATTAPAPDVVVVGHAPDVPNAQGGPPMAAEAVAAPYAVPYPVYVGAPAGRGPHGGRRAAPAARGGETPQCAAPAGAETSPTARGVGFMPVCSPR